MQFLIIYILLNTFYFLPRYILERKRSSFFPYKGLLKGSIGERVRFLINRYNYDVFRVQIDFFILTLLFVVFKAYLSIELWYVLFLLVYLLTWIYHIYYHAFEHIYQLEPLFFRDKLMFKTGAQIFFKEFGKRNILIALGVILTLFLLTFLLYQMLDAAYHDSWPTHYLYAVIPFVLLALYSLNTYNYKAYGKIAFPSSLQSLFRNIKYSLQTASEIKNMDFEELENKYASEKVDMENAPNIYFIPIESYGNVLYTHPELRDFYFNKLEEVQSRLSEKAWHSATALSTAPVTGGASWVSYSSMLFGFDFKDQGVYLSLLEREDMHSYPHMMRWLGRAGYSVFRPSPIAGFDGMKIPWDNYQSFYALDEWIKYEDMDYHGPLYGFGPCPPDQFTLHFSKEYIQNKVHQPYFLFFITQNSHSPFVGPTKVEKDWKNLDDGSAPVVTESSSIFVKPTLKDYRKSIAYQLDFLTNFILTEAEENDLFVLVGDHQPPFIATSEDDFNTPLHVISKNKAFVSSFHFDDGMRSLSEEAVLHHHEFYVMFQKAFNS